MESKNNSDQEDEMIMIRSPKSSRQDSTDSLFNPWVIQLERIEPGMMLVSSAWSDEFKKYVTGQKFEDDLQDLVKTLEEKSSQV